MVDKFLYEELNAVSKMGFLKKEIPDYLKDNLNPEYELHPYQIFIEPKGKYLKEHAFQGKHAFFVYQRKNSQEQFRLFEEDRVFHPSPSS